MTVRDWHQADVAGEEVGGAQRINGTGDVTTRFLDGGIDQQGFRQFGMGGGPLAGSGEAGTKTGSPVRLSIRDAETSTLPWPPVTLESVRL